MQPEWLFPAAENKKKIPTFIFIDETNAEPTFLTSIRANQEESDSYRFDSSFAYCN